MYLYTVFWKQNTGNVKTFEKLIKPLQQDKLSPSEHKLTFWGLTDAGIGRVKGRKILEQSVKVSI